MMAGGRHACDHRYRRAIHPAFLSLYHRKSAMKRRRHRITALCVPVPLLCLDGLDAIAFPLSSSPRSTASALHLSNAAIDDKWGVDFDVPEPAPIFPSTAEEVAEAAFQSISAVLSGKERPDPAVASNARRNSVVDYRPTVGRDRARIGIEIAGARHLMKESETPPLSVPVCDSMGRPVRASLEDVEGRAIRRVSLMLGSKLCKLTDDETSPIFVYFNTMQQTLMASRELSLLKLECQASVYDNIRVQCLEEGLPKDIREENKKMIRSRRTAVNAAADPSKGMVVLVQPSDINTEYRPPANAYGKVMSVQRLLAQATIASLPVVVVSPRLTEQHNVYQRESGRTPGRWNYQESATYGGSEPPTPPLSTPWLSADWAAPVFVWISSALNIARKKNSAASLLHMLEQEDMDPDKFSSFSYCSSVGLMQSVIEEDRPWHMFAALENCHSDTLESETIYQYMGSTKSSSGRPSSKVMEQVYRTFMENEKHNQT